MHVRTSRFQISPALILAVGSWLGAAVAEEPTMTKTLLSEPERNEIKERIAVMRRTLDALRYTAVSEVYHRFESVLEGSHNDLLGLYLDCLYETDYKRKERTEEEFRAWLKDNQDQIESPEHMLALRIQLSYLVLSMEASQVTTTAQLQILLDGILEHVESVSDAIPRLGGERRVLDEGVMDFAFADAYGLQRFVEIEDKYKWVFVPGHILQIYDRTLHPIARRSEDPAYIDKIWESRIAAETVRSRRAENAHTQFRFESFTLPTLRWRRARDLFDAGSQRQALDEMMDLLSDTRNHPDAADWIRELEGLLDRGGS